MEVKGEVRKIVKALQALSVQVEQLSSPQQNQQVSVCLYRDISALYKRIILSYCMLDMDEVRYNSLMRGLEDSVELLRTKDQGFDVRFNRKNVVENIIREYNQVTVVVEPARQLHDWDDRTAIRTAESNMADTFRERLLGVQYINHTAASLLIHIPENISFDALLS